MKSANTSREAQRVADLATEYKRKGYSVVIPHRAKDTPKFLRDLNYTPDLIARSAHETLVIEVKSRETSAALASLSRIAELVNARPGWQFVLVLTNPRWASEGSQPALDTPSGLDSDKATRLLEKSRAMGYGSQSHIEAAFLFAWAALEAALRTAPSESRMGRAPPTPWTLIRNATIEGRLARDDAHALDRLFRIRNGLLHAGDEAAPGLSDVETLRRIASELLQQLDRNPA